MLVLRSEYDEPWLVLIIWAVVYTLKVEYVEMRSRLALTCRPTTQRDFSNTEGEIGAVEGTDSLLPPLDACALARIVGNGFRARVGWHAGHEDDLVLEEDKHAALPRPQSYKQTSKDDRGQHKTLRQGIEIPRGDAGAGM